MCWLGEVSSKMQITQDDPPAGGSGAIAAPPSPETSTPDAMSASQEPQRELPWYQQIVQSIRLAGIELGLWVTSGLQMNMLPTRVAFRVLLTTLLLAGILTSAAGAAGT